jgi:tRNA A37 threonylcarbamoyladenosine dehydratase
MLNEFSRTELLIGKEALEKLKKSRVAIFGIGGVGSFVVEGLARSGVENFLLVDDDVVCLTNINRQLHASRKTIGKPKVEVMRQRVLDINPKANVDTVQDFYLPETAESMLQGDIDYIVDAIDTVTGKIDLVMKANQRNIPIISAMGAGNKLDPTRFEVADIFKTSVCPLAKVMRKELKNRGIKKLKVVYSKELPLKPMESGDDCATGCVCPEESSKKCTSKRQIPGSVSFVPSVAGLIMAGEVVKDIIGKDNKDV